MFESAELGQKIDKKAYRREARKLREQLLAAQKKLAVADFSVIILIGGVEGAGKSELVNLLLKWLDARGIQIHAVWDATDEEKERPPYWRFWRRLPPKGHMGIFFGSWYTEPIIHRVYKRNSPAEFDEALDNIISFEQMLSQENVLILKFWLHLAKQAQKKRIKGMEADPKSAWQITQTEKSFFKKYDVFRTVSAHAIRRTHFPDRPWHIIDATDKRYRTLAATKILLQALQERLAFLEDTLKRDEKAHRRTLLLTPEKTNIIRNLDLTLKLSPAEFKKKRSQYQKELFYLTQKMVKKKCSAIFVFEGPDAAGKGGAIRQLLEAVDARVYQVIAVGAPTDEEGARPYLWRFWRQVPRHGQLTIFDRSWYGRVLVERIEGFCRVPDWQRAFSEINFFEEQLIQFGICVIKFWLAVSPEEQLRRFKARQETPYKQYKLTEEDWRNRSKWDAYERAACDMIEKTSTEIAPWTLVPANHKPWAQIKVLKTTCDVLKKSLKR
ncbi:MAG: polyphosphate:AMP phosphotransferase [Gammaproteobacteria bacterium]|nr:polyphosphate:AMP phosphotransferase [Gammaproteobacteria bacterium]